jgi:hypothetical protein
MVRGSDRRVLVFVDENGDDGMAEKPGSSKHFRVTAVVFPSRDNAGECDGDIAKLRKELGFADRSEFKFNKSRPEVRRAFLERVQPHDFAYATYSVKKTTLVDFGFNTKESVYKYAVEVLFDKLRMILRDATVVFDRFGGRDFNRELQTSLRSIVIDENGRCLIKKMRGGDSARDNLLQMVDMVGGAEARAQMLHKPDRLDYRRIIMHREWRKIVGPLEEEPACLSLSGTHTIR